MPVYVTDDFREGLPGQPKRIPDISGIEKVRWRWRSERFRYFETDRALDGLEDAPSSYPGVFVQAVDEQGKVIPDARIREVRTKNRKGWNAFPGRGKGTKPGTAAERIPGARWQACKKGDPHAICLREPQRVDADTIEPWVDGIPPVDTEVAMRKAQARLLSRMTLSERLAFIERELGGSNG